ncbi:hypothetical protein [Derxia lacustris]|uniref:hypothetical protein n=1 Tax=Derxia lacustris TaxID=764842 RepID=UPI00111C0400|nr:hypothetical protein [Derxia lacustris]
MTIWANSKMSSLYYSNESASEDYACVVKIDDNEIVVEYEDDGTRQYRGKNNGDGHFELHSHELHGKASLHMFPGSSILEGSWVEGSYRGMWRIELA